MNDRFRTQDSRRIALVVISLLLCGAFASGLGGVGVATAQQSTPTGNATNGNNTVSVPKPPTSVPNGSTGNGTGAVSSCPLNVPSGYTDWLTSVSVKMYPDASWKVIKENPKKADRLAAILKWGGVENPRQMMKEKPGRSATKASVILNLNECGKDKNPGNDGNPNNKDLPMKGHLDEPASPAEDFWNDHTPNFSVKKIVKQAIATISTTITNGVEALIGFFNWVLVTLPAPGQALKPASWFPGFISPMDSASATGTGGNVSATLNGTAGNATTGIPTSPPKTLHLDRWWRGVWVMYAGLVGLVVLPLFVSWIYQWSRRAQTPRERSRRMTQIAKSFGLIILGPVILPLSLHLASMTAIGIVPSGHEFLTTGNAAKYGLGALFGLIIASIVGGVISVGLVVTLLQWVLPFILVAGWPLFCVCLASESEHIKPYGRAGLSAFVTLLILKVVQTIWLRFLFILPVDFSVGGLLAVAVIAIGVVIGFVYLPYYAVQKIVPNVVETMGKRASEVERDDIPTRSDIPSRSDLPSREDIPSREDLPGRENIPFYGSASDDGGDSGTGSTRTIGEVREQTRERTRDRPQTNRDDVATDGGVLAQSDTGRQSRRQQQVEKARHEASDGADHPDQTTLDTHVGSREESVELGEANVRQSGRLSETTQVRTRTRGPSGERTNTVSGNSSVGNTRPDVGPTEMGDDASSESGSGSGGVAAKAGAAVAVANEGRQRATQRWNGVRRRWQETKQRFPDGLRVRQRPNEGGQSDSEDEGNSENSRPQYRVQFTPGTQDQNGSESSTETTTDDESGSESSGQNKSQRRQFLRRHSSDNSRATGRGYESSSSSESGSSGESSRRQALQERYGSNETSSSDDSEAESANGESNS